MWRAACSPYDPKRNSMAVVGGLVRMTFFKNLANFLQLIGRMQRFFVDVAFQTETPRDDGRPRKAGRVLTPMSWKGAFGDTGYDAV
jgi:hypothetical protein